MQGQESRSTGGPCENGWKAFGSSSLLETTFWPLGTSQFLETGRSKETLSWSLQKEGSPADTLIKPKPHKTQFRSLLCSVKICGHMLEQK